MRGVPMGAMPSPEQSRLYAGLLPAIELSVETPICAADLENDRSAKDEPASTGGTLRSLACDVVTLYNGVAATLAWQSYGDEARELAPPARPAVVSGACRDRCNQMLPVLQGGHAARILVDCVDKQTDNVRGRRRLFRWKPGGAGGLNAEARTGPQGGIVKRLV